MGQASEATSRNTKASEVEELGLLLGQLAHEIKNPLSTVKVNLRLIDEDLNEFGHRADAGVEAQKQCLARAQRKVAIVQKETDRLEQILDGFLRFADRTEPQLQETDLNSIVGDMVDFYSPQAYSHGLTMRQQLHGEPLNCLLDPAMVKQAILNLFINAQQATAKGGELMVRTQRDDASALVLISDTGSGIPGDKLSHVWDAFYSSKPDGTGLGLPTAKNIIEAQKGRITVASEPGKGTLFTIWLPLAQEHDRANDR